MKLVQAHLDILQEDINTKGWCCLPNLLSKEDLALYTTAEELARKDIVEIVKQTTSSIPTDGDWNPDDKISGQQIAFIDNKCKQLDINVIEFINSGDSFYNDATDIKKNVATRMIRELNKYQTKETSVPEELMGYIKNWRN